MGASGEGGLREILHAQGPQGHVRTLLRESRDENARHRQAEDGSQVSRSISGAPIAEGVEKPRQVGRVVVSQSSAWVEGAELRT
jgi:hypothetical protein